MSELNPNVPAFEWNVGAEDFSPSGDPVYEAPPPEPEYNTYQAPALYPATFSYNPPEDINVYLHNAYFFYADDGRVYLQDGMGQFFGPFSDDEYRAFGESFQSNKEDEKPNVEKEDNSISFSEFMKIRDSKVKTSGPKIGFVEVAVVGTDKVLISDDFPPVEEEKLLIKIREKPKIKLIVEKPIDKLQLILKQRENPENSRENKLNEPDLKLSPVNIVFIGHVDAGKSTICGNILLLTNKIERRLIETYEQEAKDKGRDSW